MAQGVLRARVERVAVAFSLVALAWARPALADDRELPPVTAEGRAPEQKDAAERDPTGFATEIASRTGEAATAQELVLASPGVGVRDFGLNQAATLSVRGSTSDEVVVLLDGLPLNPAAGGGTDLSTIPAPLLERLTIARGAVGARYGAGALGGALLLETKRPVPGEQRVAAELSYGSFGTASGAGGASFTTGRLSTLLLGYANRSNGAFPYLHDSQPQLEGNPLEERVRENNTARRAGGLARLAFDPSASWTTELLLEGTAGDRGLPGTEQNPSPALEQTDARLAGVAKAVKRLGEGALELSASTRRTRLTLANASVDQAGPQDELAGFAEANLSWLLGRHALEGGAAVGGERLWSALYDTHSRERLAAYASDEMTFPWLSLVPAIRLEKVGTASGASAKLGASVPVGEHVALKANAGRTFRPPSFGELYLQQGTLQPNPDLRPERASYLDAGAVLRVGGLYVQAAGFYTVYDDLILYELYAPLRAKPFNFGVADVFGGELDATARRGPFTLSMGYTLASSRNRLDDERYFNKELPYHPRQRLHARLAFAQDRFGAHAELNGQSAQFINRTNTDEVDGRARLDLGAQVLVQKSAGVWLAVQLKNILGSQDVDLYGYPLPGRAVYASVRIDFPGRESDPTHELADADVREPHRSTTP